MRVLFIGDVVGRPGRRALQEALPGIKSELALDFIIANGENAAGGNGLTRPVADELYAAGVDVITMGNHVWDKKEIFDFIDREEKLLRPANYPDPCPGRGYAIFEVGGVRVGVVNLSGRVFLGGGLLCPFRVIDGILEEIRPITPLIIVDFHAEATSEKIALSWYLDGRVSALIGTHTHVQTADEKILPGGTAYITDAGMTGPWVSVLGVKPATVIEKFLLQRPVKFEVASGPYQFNAVLLDLDEETGRCREIRRINYYE
ncbi:MAG: 2,3-cyclic-nucleotide 2-phosphodiesterase [Eubacteriales bacterium]|nr:2,3-cyclic-nucleotide 2-phosphodiesterase [Eubacteriales bacterium]